MNPTDVKGEFQTSYNDDLINQYDVIICKIYIQQVMNKKWMKLFKYHKFVKNYRKNLYLYKPME